MRIDDNFDGSFTVRWINKAGKRRACFLDRADVAIYGLEHCVERAGIKDENLPRTPVLRDGHEVGSVPGWWHPLMIKSTSVMYVPHQDDFRFDEVRNRWVANQWLGDGDLEAIPYFKWSNR